MQNGISPDLLRKMGASPNPKIHHLILNAGGGLLFINHQPTRFSSIPKKAHEYSEGPFVKEIPAMHEDFQKFGLLLWVYVGGGLKIRQCLS